MPVVERMARRRSVIHPRISGVLIGRLPARYKYQTTKYAPEAGTKRVGSAPLLQSIYEAPVVASCWIKPSI